MRRRGLILGLGVCVVLLTQTASASLPSLAFPSGAPAEVLHPVAGPIVEVPAQTQGNPLKPKLRESLRFLAVEHGFRLTQAKTRREFSGPFFADYSASVKGVRGWSDGDSKFTNYVAHPMQGAVSGFIQAQNDPKGKGVEFGHSKAYWHSRLKATAWAALYSTQFEIGPISEATIGNVGKKVGTSGLVDFIVTPLGGLGLMVAEDALDRFVLLPLESRTDSARKRALYRSVFSPSRTFAKILQGRFPWSDSWRGERQSHRAAPKESPQDFGTFPEENGPSPVFLSAKHEERDGWRRSMVPFGLGRLIFRKQSKPATTARYNSSDRSAPLTLLIIQQPAIDARLEPSGPDTDQYSNTRLVAILTPELKGME